jgi:hypothetical protein
MVLTLMAAAGWARAETESFGLLQYQPPEGSVTQGQNMRAWQVVKKRAFCQFVLYLPTEGSGDARNDFVADWGEFGKARGMAEMAPAPRLTPAAEGWTRAEASREEHSAQVGTYNVRQLTYSGHRRRMSVVLTSNDDKFCTPRGEAFLASLVALRPADAPAPMASAPAAPAAPATPDSGPRPAADAANPDRAPQITDQTWYKTSASYSHWGSNFSLSEMTKLFSGQGYARKTWRFNTDGSYRFRLEVWSLTYKAKELTGLEETGRWRIDADKVTVEPQRAVIYAEDKESHKRLSEKPAKTARSVYSGRMHWLSGMKQWYLVLAPVDGRPTEREGDFDNQPGFPNAYFYGPPPKVGG